MCNFLTYGLTQALALYPEHSIQLTACTNCSILYACIGNRVKFVWLLADLRNVCTEAGMFAIRDERDYVVQEDFMKAVRKMNDAKKLETTISYDSSFGDGGKS